MYDLPLAQALEAFERAYLEHALRKAGGNIARAARAARVDRSNFRRLLKRHAMDAGGFIEADGASTEGRTASGGA
jgi:DNA-binding NtrC family response regulator